MTHDGGTKMHGHAPRVRHRQSVDEEAYELVIDRDKLLSQAAGAAIGAVVGTLATRAVFKNG